MEVVTIDVKRFTSLNVGDRYLLLGDALDELEVEILRQVWIGEKENPAVVARLPNKELLRTPKGDRLVGQVLLAARLVGTSVNDIKHWPFPVNIGIHLAEDDARSKIELSEVSLADVGMIQPLFE